MKKGLFKWIFLASFFAVFITVSIIGSMGLFKFDSIKDASDPKDFSVEFTQNEDGSYAFNLVNGLASYTTDIGAVAVRYNKSDLGAEDTAHYYNYTSVTEIEGGYKAEVEITSENDTKLKVSDYYYILDNGVEITRTIDVVEVGEDKGFMTEFSMLTSVEDSIGENDWFNPAQFYVSGTHSFLSTNARTILSSITGEAVISSADTSALVLSKYKDGWVTTMTDLSHTQQVTTYDDVLGMANNMVIDEDISVTGISYANYVDEETLAKQVKLAYCYPSHEQTWSEDGTVWRLLPVKENLSRTVSFKITIEEEKDFYSVVENSWRDAYEDLAITDKRYDQQAVYNVLLDSMYRSYSETQWGGIPQYLTNAEHYKPESGFLYRNADIALLMYKAGVRKNIEAYKTQAVNVLTKQIELDMIDSGIMSYDKSNPVYYRNRYEGLATILDVYDYFKTNNINLTGTLSQENLKDYILDKAETYKNETSIMGVIFYTKLWKFSEQFNVDYSQTAIRLLDQIAYENRFFGGYFGSVENQGDKYIGVAEDAMIILNAYINAYEVTGSTRYLNLAKTCATWLETFNVLTPMNLNLKGDDGSKPYNSTFIGNERFLAYGYNFNNTRHCILDAPTVSSAVDFEKLYVITGDKHYLDFAQRLVYNSSIYVNMGDKVGLMDDPLNSSGTGFINEFVGNTASQGSFADGGIRGAAHTSNIAWCGYQLLYVYDKIDENRSSALSEALFTGDRSYNVAKYKLVDYDHDKFVNFNYSPEKAIDGDTSTYWNTCSSYMVIDLNEICGMSKITIKSLEGTSASVKVSLSYDGVNYTLLDELSFEGTALIEKAISKNARYVKIETTSNEKITEIELLGIPMFYNTYSYSATKSGDSGYLNALDSMNYNTAWAVTGTKTLNLDFGENKIITQTALTFEDEWEKDEYGLESYKLATAHSYRIEMKSETGEWFTYAEVTDKVSSVYVTEKTVEVRYVKLTVIANSEVKLQDFKVMGCDKI